MWKDISAAHAACDSIDNTETVKILDVLENSEGILVSGMGKCSNVLLLQLLYRQCVLLEINRKIC